MQQPDATAKKDKARSVKTTVAVVIKRTTDVALIASIIATAFHDIVLCRSYRTTLSHHTYGTAVALQYSAATDEMQLMKCI